MDEKIYLLSDSACDVTPEAAEAAGLHILPFHVTYGGKTYDDFTEIVPEEFYKFLDGSNEIPTTVQVNPTRFLDEYVRAAEEGSTHLIYVSINGKGSGTYASACVARDMFREEHGGDMKIDIIDSRLYTAPYGSPLLMAANMIKEGAGFAEVDTELREMLDRAEAPFIVYTLRHMRKSGRISGGAAIVGEALGIKPVLLLSDGECGVVDKVRGTKAAFDKMLGYVKKHIDLGYRHQRLVILTGNPPQDEYERGLAEIRKTFPELRLEFYKLGVAVAVNAGPELFAIGFYSAPHGSVPKAFEG